MKTLMLSQGSSRHGTEKVISPVRHGSEGEFDTTIATPGEKFNVI
jgi:hypothetical protein